MRKVLLFGLSLLMVASMSFAQDRTVSGKVTSIDDGSTLPGVNVVVKGTTQGGVTDIDGNYKITVPEEGGTLVFSFIGLESQEIEMGNRNVIDVQMISDVQQLSEVVVTGVAGETDVRKLAFTVGKVDSELIMNAPGLSAGSALQGKIAGVSVTSPTGAPGQNPVVQLRGAANLVGSQAPLIIIDGVITDGNGGLADINTEDVESMEVVKGAAASSLYGSRAANGVINIITKRGADKVGVTTVTVRNEFGTSLLGKQISLANAHPYEMLNDSTVDYSRYSPDQIADNPFPTLYDQQEQVFGNGFFMTNQVAIGSTTEKTRFYASFNNQLNSGVISLLDGYARQNIRLNIQHDISDQLTFKTSNLIVNSTSDEPGDYGAFYSVLFQAPDANLNAPNEEDGSPYNWDASVPASLERNPLYNLANEKNMVKRNRFLGSYALEYRPLEFLKFEGQYTIDRTNQLRENFVQKGYLSDDLVGVENGRLRRSFNLNKYETASFKGTFTKDLGDINLLVQGYYLYENVDKSYTTVTGYDFRVGGLKSIDNSGFDPVSSLNRTDGGSFESVVKAENIYGIARIDYQDKIIVDGLIRRDGSSLFGVENRWNTFYRASGAYRISEDVSINGIDELKVRASIGTAGNRPSFSNRFETYTAGVQKSTLGNKNLRSSLSTELELGFDVNFLSRFRFQFTYASTKSTEQFWNKDKSPAEGGFASQWVNLDASLDATVFEATLGANIINTNDLRWDANIIFSKVDQVVSRFDNVPQQYGPGNSFYLREGEVFGTIYGQKFAKSISELSSAQQAADNYVINSDGYVVRSSEIGTVDEKAVKVEDEEGNILFAIGDVTPDFNMAFNSTLNWKGVQLYFLVDWKQGGDIYNLTTQWMLREQRAGMVDQTNVPDNEKKPAFYYQNFYNVAAPTDFYVEDGGYVKLRELSLSYNLPKSILGNVFKGVKVGFIARNLLTFTKYSGYDPEVAAAGDNGTPESDQYFGYDGFGYPNFTTLSGSIEFKF
jgi:TonB-linked SusC/RagA family outer membrane protein